MKSPIFFLKKQNLYFLLLFQILIPCTAFASFLSQALSPHIEWKLSPEELQEKCQIAINDLEQDIEKILSGKNNLLSAFNFDKAVGKFYNNISYLTFYEKIHTDQDIILSAKSCIKKCNEALIDLYHRQDLFEIFEFASFESQYIEKDQLSFVDAYKKKFFQNGVHLEKEQRDHFKELKLDISKKTLEYISRLRSYKKILQFSKEDLLGVPQNLIHKYYNQEDHFFYIPLTSSTYIFLMKFIQSSNTRKKIYIEYFSRGGIENIELMQKTIDSRSELASLLEFDSFANFKLNSHLSGNANDIIKFLFTFKDVISDKALEEFNLLQSIKIAIGFDRDQTIKIWDLYFLENVFTELFIEDYSHTFEVFFMFDNVLQGILRVCEQMFNIKFTRIKTSKIWHNDVLTFVVSSKSNELISILYYDPFTRPGKSSQGQTYPIIRSFKDKNNTRIIPFSTIFTSFPKGSKESPRFLSHANIKTLFHELGHALHQMLTQSSYFIFSGSNVTQEFLEAPAIFFEKLASNPNIIQHISKHYKNGSRLDKANAKKYVKIHFVFEHIKLLRQVYFSILDLHIHLDRDKKILDKTHSYNTLFKKITLLQEDTSTLHLSSFSHPMSGYESSYYCYLWSEVYARILYEFFLINQKKLKFVGSVLKNSIFEKGGNMDPRSILKLFSVKEALKYMRVVTQ